MQIQNYSILFPQVIFFLMDLILVSNSWKQGFASKTEKAFFYFLLLTTLLQAVTISSYACDLGIITMNHVVQYILNVCGVELIALTCYMWVRYLIMSTTEIGVLHLPAVNALLLVPLVAQFVLCLATPWSHWVFYIDGNGVFQTGTKPWSGLLSYFYWFVAVIITVMRLVCIKEKSSTLKRFFLFLIPAALGGIVNTALLRGGYTQMGFSIAAIALYLDQYVFEISENRRLRSIEALNRELVTVNEELKTARDTAEKANQAKTTFLFNMSHDIRTPMNAILGFTDIAISRHRSGEDVDGYLTKIKHSGQHLLSLINDILEMSRIESNNLTLRSDPVDIRKAIDTVSNMSHVLAQSKNIRLDVEQGEIRNPYVFADELHMNEVFINLISNAVKYTPDGGYVQYAIIQENEAPEGMAAFRFTVADNGIGMSEEFQKTLFQPFSRENNSTVSKQEGTGLGLSIVRNIVELAGGTIAVQSKTNEGSTFTVRLAFPVMSREEIDRFVLQHQPDAAPDPGRSLEGKRLLYAEDNEINREICNEFLARAGIEIEEAGDGAAALEKVAEHCAGYYDAILMDIQMPVMDGYEAAKAIRALPNGEAIPIVALSANAFKEDIHRSMEAGMNAHIAKPIDFDLLLETLRTLMNEA